MLGAASAAGALAAGLWAHARLTDVRVLRDPLYEARLRSSRLGDLDRRCAENPRRSELVVSLTTIPSRIGRLGTTLKSLLNQTRSPAAIRLHVPEWSRREEKRYDLPAWLRGLASVETLRCEDSGPATKLLPALRALPARQRILVVDDDRVYNRHLVEELDRWSAALPDAAIGARGWRVPADLTDRPTTLLAELLRRPPAPLAATRLSRPAPVDVLQGLAGYVVRPSFFELAEVSDYSGAPEAAFFVDDVWFAAHCRAPRLVVPLRYSNFASYWDGRSFRSNALGRLNRGGGDPERRHNTILIRHFRERWLVSREA